MHLAKIRPWNSSFWSAYSLRIRYLAATVLVTLVIITGALLAQSYVQRAEDMRSHHLQLRNESLIHIRLLRSAMLEVERKLNAYLWQPSKALQEQLYDALNEALMHQKHLYDLEWFKTTHMAEELNDFGKDLEGLGITLDHLMASQIASEFPALRNGQTKASSLVQRGQLSDRQRVSATFAPQFSHISEYLQRLDEKLEGLASNDVMLLNESADAITKTLWILALLGLSLLLSGVIYFERNILAPITQVARALRAEAHGQPPEPLPQAQSRETHHLIEAFTELRQQVHLRQQSLEHLALHDTLTGLANREQLVRAIEQTLNSPLPKERGLALLLIGLNRFKEINNSLGHGVGDQLLIAVAQRLTSSSFGHYLIARPAGDGFALLLNGIEKRSADIIARAVIRSLETPFDVENQSLYISATIGIAVAPEHGNQPLELLQKAEVAMQAAKRQKIALTHYTSAYDRHAVRRLALANTLREELNGTQSSLSLAYQPQVEMKSGRFCGMEALLRWNPPREGRVTADELIPIAEQTGLIYQLTPWVLERAFKEFSSLKLSDECKPMLAANLSALNLHDADFPHKLERLMDKWAIEPAALQLEITESAMMADAARAHRTLANIHALGIELTIDDFGTGFSSLSYLKHLPVSKLKIDKSFVISMLQDENDAVIIRSTIDMAHNMGLKIVAEGVENQETYDLLEILDCDTVQGYFISRPLDIAALDAWINNH